MLDKVAEILLNKFLMPRTSVQKAESEVKQKIVFLHESLIYCHNAYRRYKSDPSDENLAVWKHVVVYLIRVLEEIGTTLATFAPDAYDHVYDYADPEVPGILRAENDRSQVKDDDSTELGQTIKELKSLRRKPMGDVSCDFEGAITKLREFMRTNMTMGEIQRAQKAFKSEIAP
jgi:hypothetical protein